MISRLSFGRFFELLRVTLTIKVPTCVLYGMGIIGFLVLYGIFQEGIMTVPYNGDLELDDATILVLF